MPDHIVPLIVCGGSGTRLWPASRAARPKQFLPLFGDLSTFQETVRRVADPALFLRPVIIANRDHRFLIADQLEAIGASADVILEPEGRDSGPAMLAGAIYAAERHGEDAPVLALAADHMIRDAEGFRDACRRALPAVGFGRIVAFGVVPDHPATGYGYIEQGAELVPGVSEVTRFVEKPDAETATRYVREGYLWNSGNIVFRASVLIDEYARRDAATVERVRDAVARRAEDLGFLRLDAESFSAAAKLSIDYAVMEHAPVAVAPASFDWSDVGSWGAVRELSQQDEAGNAARGAAAFVNARDNFVLSDGPLVALVGLDELTVVATGDAVLVARRDDAAGLRALVARLKAAGSSLTERHLQAFQPWGNARALDLGARHQVKRVMVKPGGRLSLQKHHHRAEHWIVVRGTATVTLGAAVRTVHENESIFIPMGEVHRLENPGKIDLEIIEVQTGSYLGEDDIVRLDASEPTS